jgi:superoxide dismutase
LVACGLFRTFADVFLIAVDVFFGDGWLWLVVEEEWGIAGQGCSFLFIEIRGFWGK